MTNVWYLRNTEDKEIFIILCFLCIYLNMLSIIRISYYKIGCGQMGHEIVTWKLNPQSDTRPMILTLSPQPKSLDEGTRLLPSGGYTTLRTYHVDRVIKLNEHFRRLEETARLSGKSFDVDYNLLRRSLRWIVEHFAFVDKRIRIILCLEKEPGTVYFLVEELVTPKEDDYQAGVKVCTRKMHRENPQAKLTNFIGEASAVRDEMIPGINECLMISENGEVLEGLSSNFFGIINGVVRTAEEGILHGITRSMVIKTIHHLQIPLILEPVSQDSLYTLEECFITSTSRSVLPVTEIDGKKIGSGLPGKITIAIHEEFEKAINNDLESI